jgi:hypothetical protein
MLFQGTGTWMDGGEGCKREKREELTTCPLDEYKTKDATQSLATQLISNSSMPVESPVIPCHPRLPNDLIAALGDHADPSFVLRESW